MFPCLRRQTYQPPSAAAPTMDVPIAISGAVDMSMFPLFWPAMAVLPKDVFVPVSEDDEVVVDVGGRPEPPGVPVNFNIGGCVALPGTPPAAFVLVA